MALTAAYFTGELYIPNISGSSVTETANLLQLQIAIAKYETYFLRQMLGDDFYDMYAAGVTAETERWLDLQGELYVENETLGVGFSPVANYVYCKFMQSQQSLTLVHGEAKARHENMEMFTPREKIVIAWNEMVRMINDLYNYLDENQSTYPEFDMSDVETFERINSFDI